VVLIRDRNTPIAKIVPLLLTEDLDAEELALVAAGRLRLPSQALKESFWFPPVSAGDEVSGRAALQPGAARCTV
jgi:antitoxin (DNA-binding transcriptional repressor) of toxin-antitoxin stability system